MVDEKEDEDGVEKNEKSWFILFFCTKGKLDISSFIWCCRLKSWGYRKNWSCQILKAAEGF